MLVPIANIHSLIHDVNPSQLGEAGGASRRSSEALREALLDALRDTVTPRAINPLHVMSCGRR